MLSKRYQCKLWIARRLGRRWSYIAGFGSERLAPARMVKEFSDIAVFGEVDEDLAVEIAKELSDERRVADVE
ncbi:MAG: hypothetical protein PWP37_1512 [Thermotogota bacterium]|nr:hypothetical protein [Thermotogota bacterium]